MAKKWSQYQAEAADFFRSLGLSAEVNRRVEGARGRHDIDVWVTGKLQTFDVRWVVECKDWKSNVPKEKVLALQSISNDVGADRAFLLSEKGFQAGAIRCAAHTNITLASLRDLREQTREQIADQTVAALYIRVGKLLEDLHGATVQSIDHGQGRRESRHMSGSLELTGRLSILEYAVFRALHRQFPVVYWIDEKDTPFIANNVDALLGALLPLLRQAEDFIERGTKWKAGLDSKE